jgi:hypothetical protein
MTIKISEKVLDKALGQALTGGFQMQDITMGTQRTYVKPRLLTSLFGTDATNEFLTTTQFKYDETTSSVALPDGKQYHELGKNLTKDRAKTFYYEVPSFGLQFNAAPQDISGRRKPNSMDLLTIEDILAMMSIKAEDSWSNFDELALAQLITADTNIVRGSGATEYNFYTDQVGSARPAKIDMTLGTAADDFIQRFMEQRKLNAQEIARGGESANAQIVLCGDDFFSKRYDIEKQDTLARPLRSTLDLASEAVPTMSDGNFRYDNFKSHDGLIYVNYGSEIIAGTKLIADADAYIVPVGLANGIGKKYAPAQTMDSVNTQALSKYAAFWEDNRSGVTVAEESNVLYFNGNPRAITHLTTST